MLATPQPVPFDFLINGTFLTSTLEDYLQQNGLSFESNITLQYVRSLIPPKYEASFEHDDWVSKDERDRIEKLEWLDEVEEWKLLARHYCVAWGWRGQPFTKAWAAIDGSGTADERMDEDMG